MKNTIIALIVAMITCFGATPSWADDNQGYQVAGQVGSAVLGGFLGYRGARIAGANQPLAVAGGLLGANAGSEIFRASQQRPMRRMVSRGQPQYQGQYDSGIDTAYARGAQERERQDQMAAEQCAYQRGRGNYNYNCYSGYSGGGW